MILNSIRWRLQLWHGLLLVIVLAGFGFTAYRVTWDDQWRRIDRELEQRLDGLFRPPPNEGGSPPRLDLFRLPPAEFGARISAMAAARIQSEANSGGGFYFLMWRADGSAAAQSAGAPGNAPVPDRPAGFGAVRFGPPIGPPGSATLRTREDLREAFRFLPMGECVLIGRSVAPEIASMRKLALSLFAVGFGVLLLGLAGGWWLASRAIQPIEAISNTAVRIAAGDLSQRIGIADTESELGQMARVLNSTFARLETAFAHQARFTSDASHELRTPISVILSQTQTALSRERAAPEYREALEACQRAAQRMRRLTESLLDLARMDAGEEQKRREPFDLSRVVRESVELAKPLASAREVRILSDVPATECFGNSERIAQVVLNLLTNAVQYSSAGNEIHLAVRREEESVCLVVSDNGEGIPAEDLPHIFERFYRVDKSRSHVQGRTGLGLAICKAVVDAHGGTIGVETQLGSGSTFTVRLPRAAPILSE